MLNVISDQVGSGGGTDLWRLHDFSALETTGLTFYRQID